MKNHFVEALKTTGWILALTIASFMILGFGSLFGDSFAEKVMMIPFISGFIHAGFDHLALNLIMMFALLLPAVNRDYDIKRIFWLTFLISTLYLPLVILGLCPAAVGISGTAYFLLARYLWSRERYSTAAKIFLVILIIGEIGSMQDTPDIAHLVHFIGAVLGLVSLREGLLEKYLPLQISSRI